MPPRYRKQAKKPAPKVTPKESVTRFPPAPVARAEPPVARKSQVAMRQAREARERAEFEEYAAGLWEREKAKREFERRAPPPGPPPWPPNPLFEAEVAAQQAQRQEGFVPGEPEWAPRAREAIEERLRSVPSRLLYRMYGYEPFGVPHPSRHIPLGEWPAGGARPGVSGELYRLLMEQRESRLGPSPTGETMYFPPSGAEPEPFFGEGRFAERFRNIPPPIHEASKRELAESLPWSAYGRKALETVPWVITPEQEAGFEVGGYWGPPHGGIWGQVAAEPRFGIPEHEYGHAAAMPWWNDERALEFRDDILDWVGDKSVEEMTYPERYAFECILNDNLGEAYAIIGTYPQLIPPELERWYPQYDLTRRRAIGVAQPLGYGGPTPPPPPAGAGYGKTGWRW